ncbi:hypothetical protein SAMN03097699_0017 [Flavobacteriaceae bacterium MAR_2010_188]|nr:hypothetical protein SAMN03097699_0017 [Flavobacteriaceae bacterium MAR_2010_188]
MRKIYFLLIFSISINVSFAQQDCLAAQSYIIYAFNSAKLGLEANNITHLKYYAGKSLDAFKKVDASLSKCSCTNVADLTYMSIEKLENVEAADKIQDAQYFVGKAKVFAQEIIRELDACTVYTTQDGEDLDVSALEKQQLKLKEEQKLINQKQQELKLKLAKQEIQEQQLAKEQLILTTEAALTQNIQAYENLLDACNCKKSGSLRSTPENKEVLISKSIGEIRKHYLESMKSITNDYIATLDDCEEND